MNKSEKNKLLLKDFTLNDLCFWGAILFFIFLALLLVFDIWF